MHALIVVSHADPGSLTHILAGELAQGIADTGRGHGAELADLAAEGFDPRFGAADLALVRDQGPMPADVAAEQARIDRADALVLVYPVYWWSFPALLKGWIDRVFTKHWAYDAAERGLLQGLPVHLLAIGAASRRSYDKRGYSLAMTTQIEHGIFGYCNARVAGSTLLTSADEDFAQTHAGAARDIGRALFSR